MPATGEKSGPLRRACDCLWGILRMRCPRCLQGRLFRDAFRMNDPCTVCGMVVQREQGYFLGAMYISYGIASVILISVFFTIQALRPDWSGFLVAGLAVALYVPLVPAVYRYSRVLWVYFDRAAWPSESSTTPHDTPRERG